MKDPSNHKHHYKVVFHDCAFPPSHIHGYQGVTSFNVGHKHYLSGETGPAPDVAEHVHEYKGTTTFDDGHVHHFAGITGPPIPLPEGEHYHVIEGETTVNGSTPHAHYYHGIAR